MATIKDVAKEAGLAVSTVSRILNNRGYISKEAKARVYKAMEDLDYQPNELARSLHRNTSNLIGLIVPHIRHPYFSEVISHVEDQAYKKGYRILLCNSQKIGEREQNYIDICRRNRVAGIIMCTGMYSMTEFKEIGVPVIAWERFIDSDVASVECDNVYGGMLAARHLIGKGCRNILHFGTVSLMQMPGDYRFAGFKKICEEEGIEYHEELSSPDQDYHVDRTRDIMDILKKYPTADGVFANNDILAAQTIKACRECGISVPGQMKIVGYDDVLIARLTTPTITTVRQPVAMMAGHAVNTLDLAIRKEPFNRKMVFPVTLVEREST